MSVNLRHTSDLDGSRLQHMLAEHYLGHAEWPCAEETDRLVGIARFHGDVKDVIDRALKDVLKHINMWEDLQKPGGRKKWDRFMGKELVDIELARAQHFLMVQKSKEERQPEGTAPKAVRWIRRVFRRG